MKTISKLKGFVANSKGAMNMSDAMTGIILGMVVLLVFLSTVDIVADSVTGVSNASTSNLTSSEINLIQLIPLIYVIVGIMIAISIVLAFTRK